MSDREQGKKLPERITFGQFEFSSINTSASSTKDIPESAKNHVTLHSIEIQTEKGSIPLVIRSETKTTEPSVVVEKTDTEEEKLHFLNELENQMKDSSYSSANAAQKIQPPSSFTDLLQYRDVPDEQQGGSAQINIHDGTTLQILDAVSKLPPSYRHSLLGYLKAVEEEYDKSLPKSS